MEHLAGLELPDSSWIDLGCDTFTLADEAEQDVLGADVVVAELQRLPQRELEDLLGAWSEGDVP